MTSEQRQEREQQIMADVVAWGHATFPHSTPQTVMTHLLREWREWDADPSNPEEMADVMMLIAHLRSHLDILEQQVRLRAQLCHLDLAEEILRKLEINKRRTWGPPDADGVVEHVRQQENTRP